MKTLSASAIYVNASTQHLLDASRGDSPSIPISEGKRWVTGILRFQEAKRDGKALPLIFAQYSELIFWAVATDIEVDDTGTNYRFAHLCPIHGRHRNDLTVEKSGRPLPNNFIRSYALVQTPKFLVPAREFA
jgi:hypothetical protein